MTWTLGDIRLDPAVNQDTQYKTGGGVHWFLETEEGFWGSPESDAEVSKKFNQHGSSIGAGWKKERTISLEGYAFAPTFEELRRAAHRVTALLSDPYQGALLTCHSEIGDLSCEVFLDGAILTQQTQTATPGIKWSLQVVAPDPRKYDTQVTQMSATLPSEGSGGLDFSTSPNGLDFGSSNMFENPILAQGLDWWQRLENTNSDWVNATGVGNATVGTHAVRSTAVASGNYGFQSPLVAATGSAVTCSAYVMAPAAVTVTMFVGWYDASGAWLAEGSQNLALTANTWARVSATSAAKPANATHFGMTLRATATAAGQSFDATGLLAEPTTTATPNPVFSSTGGAGLVFGTGSNSTGQIELRNEGTAPTPPVFRLYGPLTNPTLTGNGLYTMKYNGTIPDGSFVEITPADTSVMLDGTASRRHLLSPAQFSGFFVPAASFLTGYGSLVLGLVHEGPADSAGYVEVEYRHAWF